jgi:hypothetical protein
MKSKKTGIKGNPKWDWDLARKIAKEVGRQPKTIVDYWREGKTISPAAPSHAKKTHQVDLALAVMVRKFNGFPQPRTAIADVCGTSAEAIRYIEINALKKLRIKAWDIIKEAKE